MLKKCSLHFIALCIIFTARFATTQAQGWQYLYTFQNAEYKTYAKGEVVIEVMGQKNTPSGMVIAVSIGNVQKGVLDASTKCKQYQCLVGVFTYSKNEAAYTSSSGLAFSTSYIQDHDPRPITAFTQSTLAWRASVTNFLSEPIMKSIASVLVAVVIGRKSVQGVMRVLSLGTADADEQERVERDDKEQMEVE